jgi:hypothetical protein
VEYYKKLYEKFYFIKESNFTVVRNSIVPQKPRIWFISEYWWDVLRKSLIRMKWKLQPDDLLLIIVSAEDPEIAAPLI